MMPHMELLTLAAAIVCSLVIGPCVFIAGFKVGLIIGKASAPAPNEPEKPKPVELGGEYENPFKKPGTL
jgi:hypothetical protein